MLAAGDGVLNKGAGIVSDYRGQLDGELKSLEGRLAGLKAQWQGRGAAGFDKTFTQWKADSAKIISALETFEANLRQTDKTFVERDEAAATAITNKYGGM
jgi:WXG100 family type VII secretion target